MAYLAGTGEIDGDQMHAYLMHLLAEMQPQSEHLVWVAHKAKVHGKTVLSQESVGCKGKKRPYSYTFTAALPNQAAQKGTVSGSAPCKG